MCVFISSLAKIWIDLSRSQVYQTGFLGVVLRAGVADILSNEPTGLHVSEISKRCKIEERKLARILRTLCSLHFFREGFSKAFFEYH